jgi:predicted lipoprotein with Yx(FWY)xxD motif
MRIYGIAALALVGGLALAACGSGSSSTQSAGPTPASQASTNDATLVVNTGDTSLGKVLTAPDGRTLYGFMKDTPTHSACVGACATTWAPVVVGAHWNVGAGLDRSKFSVITRDNGDRQVVAGKWPLYTFSGDAKAGDTNGQGSGGNWYAVGTDTKLITSASASPTSVPNDGYGQTPSTAPAPKPADASVQTGMTSLGNVLVDATGHTLYGLTKDTKGTSTCVGACATAWPPVTVSSATLPAGLDVKLFSVISRPDGTYQLQAGTWPLYRFAGDAKAGDVNGQGSGGTWYAVSPDGKLHK